MCSEMCLLYLIAMISFGIGSTEMAGKPNVVIILVDDMGFDDVSFRGSNQFLTPNIDALAYSGVILNNLYTPTMCTPSRSALLTGKYPINTGMQHYVIPNDQPWSLPLNESTMAEIFQQNGYFTSLIGKWHLGMSRKAYTPTRRGFHQHYGYLGSHIDYFDRTLYFSNKNYSRGYDFRQNLALDYSLPGTYVTDLLTEAAVRIIHQHQFARWPLFMIFSHLATHAANDEAPLQAPQKEIDKFSYISSQERRIYAAMMSSVDKSVAEVVAALAERSILNNTIILFLSDNGGPTVGLHSTTASNYPLRGQKNSPWEGGIRASASIWSTQIEKLGTIWKQKIYMADFLPTLASAVGIALDPATHKLDGINLWSALKYGYESVEREIMHNIDDLFGYVVYAKGKWKLINGTTEQGRYDGWLGSRSPSNSTSETDPRAKHYDQLIRSTIVWRELQKFNGNPFGATNISQLRSEATVRCLWEDGSSSGGGVECKPLLAPCLFDIDIDPCEQNNLYDDQHKHSKIVQEMLERIEFFRERAHSPNNRPADPRCDPAHFNGAWTWWEDILEGNAAPAIIWRYLVLFLTLSSLLA